MKRIKICCILIFCALGTVGLLSADSPLLVTVESFPSGPPPGVTGAPGETTCVKCHVDGDGGPGNFTITPPANYVPGQTYQVQVRHQTGDPSRRRWGFEMTALDLDNAAAGTFSAPSDQTQTFEGSGRQYISHTIVGTFRTQQFGAQWIVMWTAPPDDVGPITFYAAGNQANNDNTNEGDQIYTALAISEPGAGPTPTPTPTPSASPSPTPVAPTPTPSLSPTPTPAAPTPTPTPSPTPSPAASPTPSPSPTPTPMPSATVTGRVFSPGMLGVRNAIVTLIDAQNVRRTATTSSFGVYTFSDVSPGAYTLTVLSKRYRFTPNILTISGNITIDFVGQE